METPQGEGYTRDGRFILNQDGKLVTVAGNYPVMGTTGPLIASPGDEMDFSSDGKVRVNGAEVNTIKVVNFDDTSKLTPLSGALFQANSRVVAEVNPSPGWRHFAAATGVPVAERLVQALRRRAGER